MKLAMNVNYAGGFKETAKKVVELEKVGLDVVWVAEAYSADAISQVGYLAAVTDTIQIGTGIVNAFSRTPALMAMTAVGCDYVSDGRFILGIGASGPQVIEGFHGVPYEKPMQRIKEYIDVCRMVWAREQPLEYHGATVDVPLPAGEGTGLGKPLKIIKPGQEIRRDIPIWWASLKEKSVEATAAYANGWIPIFFMPEKYDIVWGNDLRRGLAKRDPSLGKLEITAGGMTAIDESLTGDAQKKILDYGRDTVALYVGGMGARGKNFYNDIATAYGFDKEAKLIQDLYLDGKKKEAAAEVPAELLEKSNLVGPRSYVKERIAAYKAAGVTTLQVNPIGDAVKTIETLRELVDEA